VTGDGPVDGAVDGAVDGPVDGSVDGRFEPATSAPEVPGCAGLPLSVLRLGCGTAAAPPAAGFFAAGFGLAAEPGAGLAASLRGVAVLSWVSEMDAGTAAPGPSVAAATTVFTAVAQDRADKPAPARLPMAIGAPMATGASREGSSWFSRRSSAARRRQGAHRVRCAAIPECLGTERDRGAVGGRVGDHEALPAGDVGGVVPGQLQVVPH
jgi:hypothetical protein